MLECCNSTHYAASVASSGPFESVQELLGKAEDLWWKATPVEEWMTAFASHSQIGDKEALKTKYGNEQACTLGDKGSDILEEIARMGKEYYHKFGHIFIISASGTSWRSDISFFCWIYFGLIYVTILE